GREMQLRRIPGNVTTEIALLVRPARAPARAQKHQRAGRDRSEPSFPGLNVLQSQPVVGITRRLPRDVDHDRGPDQLLDGNLADRRLSLRELDWLVEMGPPLLR